MNNDQSQPPKQSFWSKIFGGGKKQEDINNNAPVDALVNPAVDSTSAQPVDGQVSSIPPSPISGPLSSTNSSDVPSVDSLGDNSDPQIPPTADISPAVEQDIDSSIANSSIGQDYAATDETANSPASGFSGASFDSPVVEEAPEIPQPPADPMVTPVQSPAVDPTVVPETQADVEESTTVEDQATEEVTPPSTPSSSPPIA